MATRKQKHEAAVARRKAFEEEMRESGLKALRAERERRAREHRKAMEKPHEKHFKFADDCPHCADIQRELKSKKTVEAVAKMPRPTLRRSPAPRLEMESI